MNHMAEFQKQNLEPVFIYMVIYLNAQLIFRPERKRCEWKKLWKLTFYLLILDWQYTEYFQKEIIQFNWKTWWNGKKIFEKLLSSIQFVIKQIIKKIVFKHLLTINLIQYPNPVYIYIQKKHLNLDDFKYNVCELREMTQARHFYSVLPFLI